MSSFRAAPTRPSIRPSPSLNTTRQRSNVSLISPQSSLQQQRDTLPLSTNTTRFPESNNTRNTRFNNDNTGQNTTLTTYGTNELLNQNMARVSLNPTYQNTSPMSSQSMVDEGYFQPINTMNVNSNVDFTSSNRLYNDASLNRNNTNMTFASSNDMNRTGMIEPATMNNQSEPSLSTTSGRRIRPRRRPEDVYPVEKNSTPINPSVNNQQQPQRQSLQQNYPYFAQQNMVDESESRSPQQQQPQSILRDFDNDFYQNEPMINSLMRSTGEMNNNNDDDRQFMSSRNQFPSASNDNTTSYGNENIDRTDRSSATRRVMDENPLRRARRMNNNEDTRMNRRNTNRRLNEISNSALENNNSNGQNDRMINNNGQNDQMINNNGQNDRMINNEQNDRMINNNGQNDRMINNEQNDRMINNEQNNRMTTNEQNVVLNNNQSLALSSNMQFDDQQTNLNNTRMNFRQANGNSNDNDGDSAPFFTEEEQFINQEGQQGQEDQEQEEMITFDNDSINNNDINPSENTLLSNMSLNDNQMNTTVDGNNTIRMNNYSNQNNLPLQENSIITTNLYNPSNSFNSSNGSYNSDSRQTDNLTRPMGTIANLTMTVPPLPQITFKQMNQLPQTRYMFRKLLNPNANDQSMDSRNIYNHRILSTQEPLDSQQQQQLNTAQALFTISTDNSRLTNDQDKNDIAMNRPWLSRAQLDRILARLSAEDLHRVAKTLVDSNTFARRYPKYKHLVSDLKALNTSLQNDNTHHIFEALLDAQMMAMVDDHAVNDEYSFFEPKTQSSSSSNNTMSTSQSRSRQANKPILYRESLRPQEILTRTPILTPSLETPTREITLHELSKLNNHHLQVALTELNFVRPDDFNYSINT